MPSFFQHAPPIREQGSLSVAWEVQPRAQNWKSEEDIVHWIKWCQTHRAMSNSKYYSTSHFVSCSAGAGAVYYRIYSLHSVFLLMKCCHYNHGGSIPVLLCVRGLLLNHLPQHHQILCTMMVLTKGGQSHPPSTDYTVHVNQTWIHTNVKDAQVT